MAVTVEMLEREQKALEILLAEIPKTSGKDRDDLHKAIIEQGKRLEALSDEYAEDFDKLYPCPEDGIDIVPKIEIELTAEQRERVSEKTGIDVPSLIIHDPDAVLTENMKYIEPAFVEERALEVAVLYKEISEEAEALRQKEAIDYK